ncbi:MAG TPA: glycosyltransferase [bacterium]|nr:glycosyltransferase [bacterium]
MRILQVNKFNYPRGGADKYFLELTEKLIANGHQVAKFCMKDQRNLPDDNSRYWPSNINFEKPNIIDKVKAPLRIVYSLESKICFYQMIKKFKPDIIHAHNIYHQLSPSIIDAAREAGVPVIMTLHDYKLVCPNYQMLNHGRPCEKCLDGNFWHCFRERCFKNSLSQSFLVSLESSIHKMRRTYDRGIKLFVAPSQFLADKCQQAAWSEEKIRVINNPIGELPSGERQPQNYFLYSGRLSQEKGIEVLLHGLAETKYRLKIAGSGPLEANLRQLVSQLGIDSQVEFLGFQNNRQLASLIDGAIALVAPSIWYENMPLSVLEALGRGCPVVASKIGGLPEVVNDGINGWLFEPNNSDLLAVALTKAMEADQQTVSQKAKQSVVGLDWPSHLAEIEKLYQEVIDQTNV